MGRIGILKSLKEKAAFLEDKKSANFLKVYGAITKLECPPMIKDSTFISPNEMDVDLSKLNDQWTWEFNNLSKFS